jgi:tetratricopeptide (TPR) repeat protein
MNNKQPTNESDTTRPSDDEVVDLHLHREFSQIEEAFTAYPLQEPSAVVLARVRANAEKQLEKGLLASIKDFLGGFALARQTAWVLTIFVVVGLSYALNSLREISPHTPGLSRTEIAQDTSATPNQLQATVPGDLPEDATLQSQKNIVEKVTASVPVPIDVASLVDYNKALELYNQGQFKSAADAFDKLMATTPRFEKRQELYSYWIQALQRLGDNEQAIKRQQELQKIIAEEGL